MIFLTCSSKLATLRKLLIHGFPESLKIHGALHHVIHENPFRLQVLVDQWPEFTSVICRPPLEEMRDNSDPYTNTYFIFSKNLQNLNQMLQDPQSINWKQVLQIQGCQPSLEEVLHKISSKHGSRMKTTSNVLYTMDKIKREKGLEKLNSTRTSDLQFSPLHPDEAYLVNAEWGFGGNEHSKNYVSRCIQMFPTMCARKHGVQQPVAWVLSEQSAEIRMGHTVSAYRNQGVFWNAMIRLVAIMDSRGAPVYCHVAADNKRSQAVNMAAGFSPVGKWQQWNFQPS